MNKRCVEKVSIKADEIVSNRWYEWTMTSCLNSSLRCYSVVISASQSVPEAARILLSKSYLNGVDEQRSGGNIETGFGSMSGVREGIEA